MNITNTTIAIIFISFLLTSCCRLHTEVDYRYNGILIKRVDVCGETSFTYYDKDGKNKGKVWAEYSGMSGGFSGYLVFGEDQKVMILSGDGYFQTLNLDTTRFEYKRISYEDITLGKGVYFIMLATNYEKERNLETETEVEATYRIDSNEWW